MKKLYALLIILIYTMQIFFILGTYGPSNITILYYISLCLMPIILLVSILNAVLAIVSKKKPNPKEVYKATFIFKLILIPFYIINFAIGVMLAIGSLILWFFAFPLLLLIPLLGFFTYALMLLNNVYTIVALYREKEEIGIVKMIIQIALQFIFVVDVMDSLWIFIESRENRTDNLVLEGEIQ